MAKLKVARYISRLMQPRESQKPITKAPTTSLWYPKVKDKDRAIHDLKEELEVGLNRCQYAIAELVAAYDELKE